MLRAIFVLAKLIRVAINIVGVSCIDIRALLIITDKSISFTVASSSIYEIHCWSPGLLLVLSIMLELQPYKIIYIYIYIYIYISNCFVRTNGLDKYIWYDTRSIFPRRKNNWIHTFPKDISALWNANSLIRDLNSSRHVIFLSTVTTSLFMYMYLSIFTNPSARAGYDTRSIFKWSLTDLNSEFSFS